MRIQIQGENVYDNVENMLSVLQMWVRQLMRLEGKTWEETAKEMGIGKKTLYMFLVGTPVRPPNPQISTLRTVEKWCRRFEPIPGGRKGEKKE